MSPNLRRAAHQALDLVLDALAEEATETKTKKKRPLGECKPIPLMGEMTPERRKELEEKVERNLLRQGFRKAG